MYKINGELSDLDTYEPQFFFPEETWMETEYTVELTVTDPTVTEIFYFCHIHNGMSGRYATLATSAVGRISVFAPALFGLGGWGGGVAVCLMTLFDI